MKLCKICGNESKRKNRHGNPSSTCQKCYNKQCNNFKYRNPKVWMVLCAKLRAKRANIPFAVTRDDFEIPETCPVLGIKIEPGNRKNHDSSPSLDRTIPEKGYVKGNIAVISHRANRIKSDATLEELEKLVVWLKQR